MPPLNRNPWQPGDSTGDPQLSRDALDLETKTLPIATQLFSPKQPEFMDVHFIPFPHSSPIHMAFPELVTTESHTSESSVAPSSAAPAEVISDSDEAMDFGVSVP